MECAQGPKEPAYACVQTDLGPHRQGHVESFHGTLKREYVWPHEFVRFQDAEVVLARAFADYNNDRIHSALGYVTPNEFARKVEDGNK